MFKSFRVMIMQVFCLVSACAGTVFKPTIQNIRAATLEMVLKPDNLDYLYSVDEVIKKVNRGESVSEGYIALENNRANVIEFKMGIVLDPTAEYVFISSRGFANTDTFGKNDNFLKKGAAFKAAYWLFRDYVVNHYPCITFDYPEESAYLNLGQDIDQACLQLVYDEVRAQAPNAKIILIGDCRGAKVALSVAAKKPENLAAMILLSPFASVKELFDQIGKSFVWFIPKFGPLFHYLGHKYLHYVHNNCHYDPRRENVYKEMLNIDATLPIFIAHRVGDKLISDQHITRLVNTLRSTGNNDVHYVEITDNYAIHSKVTPNRYLQQMVNRFLKRYQLPYAHHFYP